MKIFKLILFTIFISIILISCSGNPPTEIDNQSAGNISLKFDKINVPESVVVVKATLTRVNFEPIVNNLDLINSNSAELLFTEIHAGEWHLKVDALDDQQTILFTGETDLTVIAGEVTTVTLTLSPTGNGTGSIYLFVNWDGTNQYIDYPQNPIIEKQGTYYDPYGVRIGTILKHNGTYYMWFNSQSDHGKAYVNLATSSNGLDWQEYSNNPVLLPGPYGSWDDLSVPVGTVIYSDNIFRLYYTGFRDSFGQWSIGLATSVDGIVWEKFPNPVLSGSMLTGEYKLAPNFIIKIDGIYFLYYYGKNDIYDYKIFAASSPDGIVWTKLGELQFNDQQPWEADKVAKVSIVKNENQYQMVYVSADAGGVKGFGEAFSQDGMNWIKNNSNPVFTKDMTIYNYYHFGDAFLLKNENEYRIYYSGWIGDIASVNVARQFIF